MMSTSFQIISERADVEWKFARSRLWINYFENGDILPPPFNILPNTDMFRRLFATKHKRVTISNKIDAKNRHDAVVRLLIKRFVTAEQRKRHEFGITEDDVIEIRQDISSLRYDIVDILGKNGMSTPNMSFDETQGKEQFFDTNKNSVSVVGRKGKMIERRILKDFQIGVATEVTKTKRKSTFKKRKKDWNALVRQNAAFDPIGSSKMLKSQST